MIDYEKKNGPIGSALAALYTMSDVQLGIAFAIDHGVWHRSGQITAVPAPTSERLWKVDGIQRQLEEHNGVFVLDPDNVLPLPPQGCHSTWVSADDYRKAAQLLAVRLKDPGA